jgi:hypothetical protein
MIHVFTAAIGTLMHLWGGMKMPEADQKQVIGVWSQALKAEGRDQSERTLNQMMAKTLYETIPRLTLIGPWIRAMTREFDGIFVLKDTVMGGVHRHPSQTPA